MKTTRRERNELKGEMLVKAKEIREELERRLVGRKDYSQGEVEGIVEEILRGMMDRYRRSGDSVGLQVASDIYNYWFTQPASSEAEPDEPWSIQAISLRPQPR